MITKTLAIMLLLLSLFSSSHANTDTTADGGSGIWNPTYAMCAVYRYAAGPIGKTLALLCLVMIGISFFMSKVSWTTALSVALGISAIFGAPTIVNLLTGGGGDGCATVSNLKTSWGIDSNYQFGGTTAA